MVDRRLYFGDPDDAGTKYYVEDTENSAGGGRFALFDADTGTELFRWDPSGGDAGTGAFEPGAPVAMGGEDIENAGSVSADESRTAARNITLNVPTDFQTVNAAIGEIEQLRSPPGVTVTVNIESGHAISEEIDPTAGARLAHVTITSEDATVSIASGFTTTHDYVLFVDNTTVAPVWDVTVDASGVASLRGILISQTSIGRVTPNGGIINAASNGINVNRSASVWIESGSTFSGNNDNINVTENSIVTARNVDARNAGGIGVRVSAGSVVDAGGTDVSGSNTGVRATDLATVRFDNGAVAADCATSAISTQTGARVVADGVDASNAGGDAVDVSGGRVIIDNANVTGADRAVRCERGFVSMVGANASGSNTGPALYASTGGEVIARGADLQSPYGVDVDLYLGGLVWMHNATTTNGSPDLGDVDVAAFNDAESSGIVFA